MKNMNTFKTSMVTLPVRDGTSMNAYVAQPEQTGNAPAILVLQEAYGVNAHIRDITERFARAGYVAIAPELYHRTAPGFQAAYTDFENAKPHMLAMTDDGLESDLHAAYDWLKQGSNAEIQIHAIGFCMGGKAAFIANSILPLTSAVSFYGGGTVHQLARVPRLFGRMLLCYGGKDTHIDRAQRDTIETALMEARRPYTQTVFSEADHGFFCDARASYHAPSAAIVWPLVLNFLEQSRTT